MKLHEAIIYAREVAGKSLRDLEKDTGISSSLLSQIETGRVKEPSFRKIAKIAKVLNISLDRLAKTE